MKNISIVQAVIFIVAVLAIIVAVFMFSFYRGGSSSSKLSNVLIWGTISEDLFYSFLQQDELDDQDYSHVTYVEKDVNTFENELVQSLAEGEGPDLVFLRENQILKNKNVLVEIPYEKFDLRSYKDTFIEEGNLLAMENGLIGVPFSVDPLVLYYNKDILNSFGISKIPTTWTEMTSLVDELTKKDSLFNISKTTIPLGTFDNIKNSKEIVWTLLMQSGNNVFIRDNFDYGDQGEVEEIFTSDLFSEDRGIRQSTQSAINFYTQFANPSTTAYSWNGSLPNSEEFFLSGDSAFYLGFASELPKLKEKNPYLNFDVAEIPQAKDATKKTTFGKMYSISITKGVDDINSSFETILMLISKESQEKLYSLTGLPSVRRDMLSFDNKSNSFDPVFKKSALFSYAVLEPNSRNSDSIIREMVKSILSGQYSVEEALSRADGLFAKDLEN